MLRRVTHIAVCLALLCGLSQKMAAQDVSVRTNLAYAATATPNLAAEVQVGEHVTLGVAGGLKPWPRWLAWDWDADNPVKWRHFSVVPELRWYPRTAFDGWFVGADGIYLHYNAAGLQLPLGLYPAVRDSRLQGDFFGAGLFGGHAWYLSSHFRLEVELGLGVGYFKATQYECPHCGKEVGPLQGVDLIPRLGVNLAYNLRKRGEARKAVLEQIQTEEVNNK